MKRRHYPQIRSRRIVVTSPSAQLIEVTWQTFSIQTYREILIEKQENNIYSRFPDYRMFLSISKSSWSTGLYVMN